MGAMSAVDARVVEERFSRMFRQHAAAAYRTVLCYGVHPADAEDCVAQVFLVVHERLSSVRPQAERAFVCGVASRIAANARRAQRRRAQTFTHLEASEWLTLAERSASPSVVDPEQYAVRAAEIQALRKALGALSDKQRSVLVLCELEGSTAPEASRALGIPETTVHSRLRKARAAFERYFQRESVFQGEGDQALQGRGREQDREARSAIVVAAPTWHALQPSAETLQRTWGRFRKLARHAPARHTLSGMRSTSHWMLPLGGALGAAILHLAWSPSAAPPHPEETTFSVPRADTLVAMAPRAPSRSAPPAPTRREVVPAASAAASPAFFDLTTHDAQKQGTALDNHCLGTWDEASQFPGHGFSAQSASNYLYGRYHCEVQWKALAGATNIVELELSRAAERPIVGCETGRGLRVPLWVRVEWLGGSSAATVEGAGAVLVQDEERFSLSFRRQGEFFFSFFNTGGLWRDLARHRVLEAQVTYRARGPLRHGELACHRLE